MADALFVEESTGKVIERVSPPAYTVGIVPIGKPAWTLKNEQGHVVDIPMKFPDGYENKGMVVTTIEGKMAYVFHVEKVIK